MSLKVIATKVGKLLECDDGVEIVSNGHLPTKSDILRHFVRTRAVEYLVLNFILLQDFCWIL